MNWKNVLFLTEVERKSGRLVRGIKATRYRENSFLAYWPYWVALVIGIPVGVLVSLGLSSVSSLPGIPSLRNAEVSFFVSLPTLVLIFCFVISLLQQIQRSSVKASTQVMYWLPVTWQENTLASILASLLGFPLALVIGLASGIIAFSFFNGLIIQALLTAVALFAAAFMASSTTEILSIIQVRFIGAVYKSSGRAAIWIRFIGSLLFFIIFYILYFYVTTGFSSFIQGVTRTQDTVWFIPFVWLGETLFYLVKGLFLQGFLFLGLSALFIAGLYYLAVWLNTQFGLYEPPAITVQKSGLYSPKTGLLGKLGFSTVEAAIIRKDLKAFTRRRELIPIFIVPVVFIIITLFQSINISYHTTPTQTYIFLVGTIFALPAGAMAMGLGNVLIGEEGRAIWRIYASPISAKNFVKSKFFFATLFSTIILLASGFIGIVFYHPSLRATIVAFVEAFFVLLTLSSISLEIGFKGADFSETRIARMVRQEWSLIGIIVCVIAGVAVLAPLLPYVIFTGASPSSFDLAISVIVSGVIALIITAVFYRMNTNSARELLRKAEV